jgi:hypothetical protein
MNLNITLTPAQVDAVRTWWSPGKPPEHAMTAAESKALQDLEEAIAASLPPVGGHSYLMAVREG